MSTGYLSCSRRGFIFALASGFCKTPARSTDRIDRRQLVQKHNPVLRKLDPQSPFSVGNGEFAFTADVTGLQTLSDSYDQNIPLCTQSQWGWHSFPRPEGFTPENLRLTPYDTYGRSVYYPTGSDGQQELFNWLRENPHRLHLGKIGFILDGRALRPLEVAVARQMLDLWTGILHSSFNLEDSRVIVETCCHPQLDMVAVKIRSPLLSSARLGVVFDFPYGSPQMQAADWTHPDSHQSRILTQNRNRLDVARELNDERYTASIGWEGHAGIRREGPHRFVLQSLSGSETLNFVCLFALKVHDASLPDANRVFVASDDHWRSFWLSGGALELNGSREPRATELERRIILSQYLTAIQCAGSLPPQETGLTCNSWYGKFHLEMHWWHAAHFALWGRVPLLERSLGWYQRILPVARSQAKKQGYAGARWPKMVGPEGWDSPSPIGPLLIWQQPHPIAFAELCYQAHPNRATLDRYKEIVFESAAFMASFAVHDPVRNRYVLGPPVIPAQENHPPRETWNPAFELEYWALALGTAQRWRRRLGLRPEPRWEAVHSNLSALPEKDGVYLAHENCPRTYTDRNRDHPSMLAAMGMLPGSKVEVGTMRRTLKKVLATWRWADTWGWDYPMVAMTAARIGEPELAIDALMMNTPKNTWLPNGHNWQRPNLPLYLPANGGLLAATAMMACGWQGGPKIKTPGFPTNAWTVRWEKLEPFL